MTNDDERIQKAADLARACAESDDAVTKILAEIAALPPETKKVLEAVRAIRRDAHQARLARSRE